MKISAKYIIIRHIFSIVIVLTKEYFYFIADFAKTT